MEYDFEIPDSSVEERFEYWLANEYLAVSARIKAQFEAIFADIVPNKGGPPNSKIKEAVFAYRHEAEAASERVWAEAQSISKQSPECLERAFQTLLTLSNETERKLASKIFSAFKPMRNWDLPIYRIINQQFLAIIGPEFDRNRQFWESIEAERRAAAIVETNKLQQQWIRSYNGINSKKCWNEFHLKFPDVKKLAFESLFIAEKGKRDPGRPKKPRV